LFDNHNIVLFPFIEVNDFFNTTSDIVHIDAHRDDAIFPKTMQDLSFKNVQEAISVCRVSDYLDYAKKSKIIGDVHSITQSFEFENFQIPKKPYILNLDLDIFGEEGSCVFLEQKIQVIAETWAKSDAVCLATSPGFIDQDFAFNLVKIFTTTSP